MPTFNLFTYGSLRAEGTAAGRLAGCELVGSATVNGILYDIRGEFRALILYGESPIEGDVWRCPASMLASLDEYEGVATGLFRRVGHEARTTAGDRVPCWIYVAGPALRRNLVPESRILTPTRS
jgi:gamma-glutamylcyclotransferase (GGCT)/AIG2-like uncharacterized protein YtfP